MDSLSSKLSSLSPDLFIHQAEGNYRTFSQGKEASLYNPLAIRDEITAKGEQFSKLKFQYLEQETREKFLRAILEHPPLFVEQSDVDRKAETNQALKKDLKGLKLKQQELGQESRTLANEVLDLHEVFQGKMRASELMLEEIEGMEEELAKLTDANKTLVELTLAGKSKSANLAVDGDDDNIANYDNLEAVSTNLTRAMEHENSKLSRLNSEMILKQELLESHNRNIKKLEDKLIQLKSNMEQDLNATHGQHADMSNKDNKDQILAQWVKSMSDVWSEYLISKKGDLKIEVELAEGDVTEETGGQQVIISVVRTGITNQTLLSIHSTIVVGGDYTIQNIVAKEDVRRSLSGIDDFRVYSGYQRIVRLLEEAIRNAGTKRRY